MKKRFVIISIPIILFVGLLWLIIGTNTVVMLFHNKTDYASAAAILEIRYTLNKNHDTLATLCNELEAANQKDENHDYNEKFIKYFEIMLEDWGNTADTKDITSRENDYLAYLTAVLETGDRQKFMRMTDEFLRDGYSPEYLWSLLDEFVIEADDDEKTWVKDFADKILNGNYIVADTQEGYEKLVEKYEILANS